MSSPPDAPTSESLQTPESPYRGLTPYSEQDAPLFFGREDECDVVIDNMMASRLTLLYGASGVGKTSLLRAGVTHELLESSRRNVDAYRSPEFVVVYFNRWSDDPLTGLIRCIHESARPFRAGLTDEPPVTSAGLAETLHDWTTRLDSDLLIILDQFEEYFLYHPADDGDGSFAVEFARAVNRADLRVSFLIAIREDALARLDRFKGRLPNVFGNYLRTRHLDAAAARDAIEKPLAAYNRLVPGEEPFTAEPELVQMVLDQVQIGKVVLGTAGRGTVEKSADQDVTGQSIETPYLQLVLIRLWQQEIAAGSSTLRVETLQQLGGAQQIVRTHLDEALRALSVRQRDVAAGIFHHLVTPSGTKIAHTAPDLADYAHLPEAEVVSVLEELSRGDVRILRPVPPPSGRPDADPAYEIFHDVLAPAVLDWRARYVVAQAADERLHEARRRLRRLGSLAATLGILLIAAVAFAVLALYQSHQADAQRDRAAALSHLATARQLSANATGELEDRLDRSLLLSLESLNAQDTPEARASLLAGLQYDRAPVSFLSGHTDAVLDVAFTPDGRTLASASGDRTVRLWDVARARQVAVLRQDDRVRAVGFAPDGRTLASGGADGRVWLWDVARRRHVEGPRRGYAVTSVGFTPDGRTLVVGSEDGTVSLWNLAGGRLVGPPLHHGSQVNSVAVSPDGTTVASAADDGSIRLWSVKRHRQTGVLAGHRNSPGRTVVYAVAFSRDGRMLASAGEDETVRLWDVARRSAIGVLRGHTNYVTSVAFDPSDQSGRTLASGSLDRTIRLWDVRGKQTRTFLRGQGDGVEAVAFSSQGALASGARDSTVLLARPDRPSSLGVRLAASQLSVTALASSPGGQVLAAGIVDGSVVLFDAERRTRLRTLLAGGVPVLAFSPDGRVLAAGTKDGSVVLFDPGSGTRLRVLEGARGEVSGVAFSPDGRVLAAGTDTGWVTLFDPRGGSRQWAHVSGPGRYVSGVAFTRDGLLAVADNQRGGDRSVTLWDPVRRVTLQALPQRAETSGIAFSPDGRTLAALNGLGLEVWDMPARASLGILQGQEGETVGPAFALGGRVVAVGSLYGDVVLWDVDMSSWRRLACTVANRNLTVAEWQHYLSPQPYRRTCGGLVAG
jgi:WD40 repeat protein